MNILHLVQSFDISGRSKVIYDLSYSLEKDGFRFLVASLTSNVRYAFCQNGLRCVNLDKKEGFDISVIWKLIRIIKDEKISLIHTHGKGALLYGVFAKKLSRVKGLVHTVHRADGDLLSENRLVKQLIASFVDKVIAVSDSARLKFTETHNFPLSKTITIYNGIDISKYERNQPIDSGLCELRSKARLIIGTVANLSYDKDLETLLLAFSEVVKIYPDSLLIVAGDGPKANELKRFAEKLGVSEKVKFLGFRNDVPGILQILDIFVLSTRTEGLGIALLEAMAAKVPVVASAVEGVKEVVEDGVSGKLFTYGNPQELKDSIISLLKDKKLCDTFMENGYRRVKNNFSLEKMSGGYERIYSQLIRKKIMHIVLNFDIGGLENLVFEMARMQSKRNEVIVCSLEPEVSSRKIEVDGFKVVYLNRKPGRDFRLLFELHNLLRHERPDIVHTHNIVPLVYGALARFFIKIPVLINTRHGQEDMRKPGFFWNAYDFIITISHSAKDRLLANNKIEPKKIRVIHNGIDISRFNGFKEAGSPVPVEKNGRLVVGTVTRLDHYKDIPNLISGFEKVFNYFGDAELWIIGDGPMKKELEEFVFSKGLGEKVIFWGWQKDIASIDKEMDVFVLPSVTEGISIALLEAMACGRPIVATRVGGNPEIVIDGETGFLVSPKEPDKMAEAIIKVLSDREMAKKMGEAGRRRVEEEFSLERMVREYEKLYKVT